MRISMYRKVDGTWRIATYISAAHFLNVKDSRYVCEYF